MFGYACRETPELMPAPIFYAHHILKVMSEARRSGETLGARTRRQEPGDDPLRERQAGRGHPDRGVDPALRREAVVPRHPGDRRALCAQGPAGGLDHQADGVARQSDRQIRDRRPGWRLPGSPGARSSSTPMAARRPMAAARFPARTRPRSTARPPMPRAISPRTWWRPGLPIAAPYSSPMRSASPSRCRSTWIATGPGRSPTRRLEKTLSEVMDLTPRGIREHLGLNRPIYARTSAYGHFGRPPEPDGGFSWEHTDLVDELRRTMS